MGDSIFTKEKFDEMIADIDKDGDGQVDKVRAAGTVLARPAAAIKLRKRCAPTATPREPASPAVPSSATAVKHPKAFLFRNLPCGSSFSPAAVLYDAYKLCDDKPDNAFCLDTKEQPMYVFPPNQIISA